MKNTDISKIVLEGLIGMALTLSVEVVTRKIKEHNKKKNLDTTLVGDLTVEEFKKILEEV